MMIVGVDKDIRPLECPYTVEDDVESIYKWFCHAVST